MIEKRVVENGFRPRTYFYHWNALNQLVRYITSQGDEWHYQYDAFGRRIRKFQVIHHDQQVDKRPRPGPLSQPKSQPKIGCEYYYLGDPLIEEAPIYADGTVAFEHSTHWLYAPNQLTPTARYQQGELNYVITDQIGTPTELLAEDGTGRWRVKHNLWGSILKQYSVNDDDFCNLRFPGQYLDNESGLHYNRHRYYDPNTAQYLTTDPIGLAGGFNPYGYVHNPTGWIDPLGLVCCEFDSGMSRVEAARLRQAKMLQDNIGYNISPKSWEQYPSIGKNGTFVTDKEGALKYFDTKSGEINIPSSLARDI
nr:RHS repeat-associated core domain-containing protein [Thorsellia anophelis]